MTDLVEWLRAQLDEDERIARAAADTYGGSEQWRILRLTDEDYGTEWSLEIADRVIPAGLPGDDEDPLRVDELHHIARHDPARVLRQVKAYREILAEHRIKRADDWEPWDRNFDESRDFGCSTCHFDRDLGTHAWGYCNTLRALASIYSHRPGFKPEWSTVTEGDEQADLPAATLTLTYGSKPDLRKGQVLRVRNRGEVSLFRVGEVRDEDESGEVTVELAPLDTEGNPA